MQKTFDDCLSTKNWKLKFDFYLPEQSICIEYDGLQHFKPIDYFGGVKSFNELKQRDSIKDKYCLENNIKLIRIPFDKYYFIDDILISEIIY
jgi:very-short-patch-repair endonuclease